MTHLSHTRQTDLAPVSGLGKISLYSRKMNTAFSEVADAVGKELNSKYNLIREAAIQWQAFPGKDKYDLYVEFTKELMTLIESRGGYYYAELMDVIGQQFLELSASLESATKKYEVT
uniref:Uncharacterized protein n=1 Tax=Magallana gigas TaxID=29159 RepID=K1PVP3_MAGGI